MARRPTRSTDSDIDPNLEGAPESTEETSAEASVEEPVTSNALEATAQPEDDSFADAIREGASDARDAVAGFFPAVGKLLHKGVYNGFYYVSYGVVFGSLVVGSLIPANSAAGQGIRQGAKAAQKDFGEREKSLTEAVEGGEGLATA